MQTYITGELGEDDKANAITVPAEVIDPATLVLADHRPNTSNCGSSRASASARCLEIFRENGGDAMDFSDEKPPQPSPLAAVRRLYGRYAASLTRWWLWNVSYPVRMWLHFRFYREKTLPEGRNALRAMLREAFAAAGVTDLDLPYPVYSSPVDEKPVPNRFCLIFNRKRVKGD